MTQTGLGSLVNVAHGLLSSNAEIRSQAERELAALDKNRVDLILCLIHILSAANDTAIHQICAVVLRQTLQKSDETTRSSAIIRRSLLLLLAHPQCDNMTVYKSIAHAVAASGATKEASTWDELIPAVLQLASSPESFHRLAALILIDKLAEFNFHMISSHLATISPYLGDALSGSLPELRQAAIGASISILVSLPTDQAKLLSSAGLLPLLLRTLTNPDSEVGIEAALTSIIELVGYKAQLFDPYCQDICNTMVAISREQQFDINTRKLALEMLTLLAREGLSTPNRVGIGSSAVQVALHLLAENIEQRSEDFEDEDDDDAMAASGDALCHLCESLGLTLLMRFCLPHISQWIQPAIPNNKIIASFYVCRRIIEGGPEELGVEFLEQHLAVFVNWISQGAQHSSHHVRISSLRLLNMLCTKTSTVLTVPGRNQGIISILAPLLSDPSPVVVEECCLCIAVYCTEERDDPLDPEVVNILVQSLCQILNAMSLSAQLADAALTAMSSLAQSLQSCFLPFYDSLMPALIGMCSTPCEMRGKAVECASIIGISVGAAIFAQHAPQLTEICMMLFNSSEDDEDWVSAHQSLARINQCMGVQFMSQFLPSIIADLFTSAGLDDRCSVDPCGDGEEHNATDGAHVVTVDVRGLGTRRITINPALMARKAAGCHILYQYAHDLNRDFSPWSQQAREVMFPLIACRYNESVRLAAVASVSALIGTYDNRDAKHACAVSAMPFLIKAIGIEPEFANVLAIIEACSDSIKALDGSSIGGEFECKLSVALEVILAESAARRDNRSSSTDHSGSDEFSYVMDANNDEVELQGHVVDAIGAMAQSAKQAYLTTFQALLEQRVCSMLTRSEAEQVSALCIFDEIIEHCGPKAAEAYIGPLLPVFIEKTTSKNSDLCQSAAYGLGVIAQVSARRPSLFPIESAFACLEALRKTIRLIDAELDPDDFGVPRDNAVSSLGKLLLYRLQSDPSIFNLVAEWCTMLVCSFCPIESHVAHNIFCKFLEICPQLLQKTPSYDPSSAIFAMAVIISDELSDTETLQRLRVIWSQQSVAASPLFEAVWKKLSDVQRSKLGVSY